MKRLLLITTMLALLVAPVLASFPTIPWEVTYRGLTPDEWSSITKESHRQQTKYEWNEVITFISSDGEYMRQFTELFYGDLDQFGATDSVEECADETSTACTDNGYSGSANAQLVDDPNGGCVCSADCIGEGGGVAIIMSQSPCGGTDPGS